MAVVLLALVLTGCGPALRWSSNSQRYVVQKGDTLYSIAFRQQLDFHTLAKWNGIQPPYTIYPGETLRLTPPPAFSQPHRHTRVAQASSLQPPSSPPTQQASPPTHHAAPTAHQESASRKANERHRQAQTEHGHSASGGEHWRWPAAGKVVRDFDPAKNSKGIDIAGKLGEPVRASATGHVVYSGDGLKGYGRLIIIKHGESYLSAYGHNSALEVQEGDEVRRGEVIAKMGMGPERRPMLHFEIRRRGKPVNPLSLLPKHHSSN